MFDNVSAYTQVDEYDDDLSSQLCGAFLLLEAQRLCESHHTHVAYVDHHCAAIIFEKSWTQWI